MVDFYREIAFRRSKGESMALATIIEVKGSAPRKPGAKMAVLADGRIIGTVGGGCGEAAVIEAALDIIRIGIPRVVHVDLTADVEENTGMICGGIMDVFVEPLPITRVQPENN